MNLASILAKFSFNFHNLRCDFSSVNNASHLVRPKSVVPVHAPFVPWVLYFVLIRKYVFWVNAI